VQVPCHVRGLPHRQHLETLVCGRKGSGAVHWVEVIHIKTKRSLVVLKSSCRIRSLQYSSLKMLKLKAFCLDYWQKAFNFKITRCIYEVSINYEDTQPYT